MISIDRYTRDAIVAAVKKATIEANEIYSEEWISGQQLCDEIGFFTKEWLKRYGQLLPRECVRVTDSEGILHRTGWSYPKKKILRMLSNGEFRNLKIQ